MCGIDGFLDLRQSARGEDLTDIVARMTTTLVHRGPDASGSWVDADAGIALGHRRLSIIDLTDAGAQPMHSASGRYVISYNGEIYNAVDLAHELTASGHALRGHCDTEVLLEAIDAWGLDRALERSNGHVRLRAVGPTRAAAAPGPRPSRREAPVLRLGRATPSSSPPSSSHCAPTPPSAAGRP